VASHDEEDGRQCDEGRDPAGDGHRSGEPGVSKVPRRQGHAAVPDHGQDRDETDKGEGAERRKKGGRSADRNVDGREADPSRLSDNR